MRANDHVRSVALELHNGTRWMPAGSVDEYAPPGSLSSAEPAGRQVYVFGFIDGTAGVWRSIGGADIETPAARAIISAALVVLSDLAQPCELNITRRDGGALRVRLSLVSA